MNIKRMILGFCVVAFTAFGETFMPGAGGVYFGSDGTTYLPGAGGVYFGSDGTTYLPGAGGTYFGSDGTTILPGAGGTAFGSDGKVYIGPGPFTGGSDTGSSPYTTSYGTTSTDYGASYGSSSSSSSATEYSGSGDEPSGYSYGPTYLDPIPETHKTPMGACYCGWHRGHCMVFKKGNATAIRSFPSGSCTIRQCQVNFNPILSDFRMCRSMWHHWRGAYTP